jgi:ribonuclease VapC
LSIFVDASATVAILAMEPDAIDLIDRLGVAESLLWSSVARWETVVSLARKPEFDAAKARDAVLLFGRDWDFTLVPIGEREDQIAFQAYRTYGKGTGHPARLNMGDCFAYACAKANGARLLYKGDDFAATDLAL